MSNIDNIFNKIIKDAEEKSRELEKEAEEKGKNLVMEKELLAQNLVDSIINKAEEEAPQIIDKKVAAAELLARDKILNRKVEIIDNIIEKAKEELSNIDEETYINFVKKSIKKMDLEEEAEIIVPEERKFSVVKANLGLKISRDSVENGFSIKSGKIFYNNTFDAIIDSQKAQLEKELAGQLSKRR